MNRGDRREATFEEDKDRGRLLATLTSAGEKTSWQVHADGLLSNHFHLVIETPQPNLVVGITEESAAYPPPKAAEAAPSPLGIGFWAFDVGCWMFPSFRGLG